MSVAPPPRASGYKYRSHLSKRTRKPVVGQVALTLKDAKTFASMASALRTMEPDELAAHALIVEHPALGRYFSLAAELRAEDVRNAANASFSGVHRHLGRLFNWPVTEEEWETAFEERRVLPKQPHAVRGLSSTHTGQRADGEVLRVISGEDVLVKDMHKLTKWILMYMFERRWLPLDGQLPLWSKDGRSVRTWVDISYYNLETRRVGVMELKTGYRFEYEHVRTTGGAHGFRDSDYNRHQLQLGWMHACLLPRATAVQIELEAVLVRINGNDGILEPLALSEEALAFFANVYPSLNSWTLGAAAAVDLAPEGCGVPADLCEAPVKRRRKK